MYTPSISYPVTCTASIIEVGMEKLEEKDEKNNRLWKETNKYIMF